MYKRQANFGVEDSALTDACFPVFSAMPKLRYLLLDGNAAIHGSGLPALQGCKLDLLTLNHVYKRQNFDRRMGEHNHGHEF